MDLVRGKKLAIKLLSPVDDYKYIPRKNATIRALFVYYYKSSSIRLLGLMLELSSLTAKPQPSAQLCLNLRPENYCAGLVFLFIVNRLPR